MSGDRLVPFGGKFGVLGYEEGEIGGGFKMFYFFRNLI
jgi:hypothetical protein